MVLRRKTHPDTLGTVNSMALVYYDNQEGNYKKALEWYQRALDGKEASLGSDHPDTLGTVNNMAGVYDNQGNYEKALEWYQRALDGREASLVGSDHPRSTLQTAECLLLSIVSRQMEAEDSLPLCPCCCMASGRIR
jgi:tetratricopeptide (TPR) repeat protein